MQPASKVETKGSSLLHLCIWVLVGDSPYIVSHQSYPNNVCSSVCAVSTVRLLQLISQRGRQDFTFDIIGVAIWTLIEVNTAIVCACIMTLKPLIAKLFPNLLDPRGMSLDTPPGAVVSQGGRPLTIGSKPFRVIRESWLLVHDHRVDSDAPILRELRDAGGIKNGRVSLQALEAQQQDDFQDVDLPAALPAARIHGSDMFDSSSTEQLTLPEPASLPAEATHFKRR